MRHRHFMEQALEQARAAERIGEVPVGSVVVKDDRIVAIGHNLRERDQDPTAHAELLAMREAAQALGSWRLEGCTVYVTLEPCAMCAGAMVLARVKTCVFGATDPRGGFLGTLGDLSQVPALNHHFQVEGGVMAEESSALLKGFFQRIRAR
jgi:tRNA(adenine34) deaminase